ncbi:MAG: glycine amidinotransferase, partial [Mesorhizobium sp.]
MVLGDEIIETPPLIRGRYFENDLVKDHLLEYFKRGARWTIAPRPLMIDESFDRSYSGENPTDTDISKFEIMFDGAQCVKFGRDIVMNAVNENHRLGAVWLERHLGGRFRVHQVEITDNHIDGHLLPLRPGTLLVKQAMFDQWNRLPKGLQSWDAIIFADEEILNADSKET